MAAHIAASVKRTVEGLTVDAKSASLLHHTVDPSEAASGQVQTTMHGLRVHDTDNWLRAHGGNTIGPALLEDQIALEKIHRFDHERIPERIVHARGSGAHGYFRVYDDSAAKYTSAKVLTDSSRKTPVFVRFSTVQGSRGSADSVRDVRGFAIKFYTDEGNWDLVGNDIPVFFIQDAIKFPDFVHSVKPEPHNEVPQGQSAHTNFYDFTGLQPETAHMIQWAMSDRGIPRSFRMMQGFGVNTYTLSNDAGERVFVKFHLVPELGVHSLAWDEALKLNGQDPDFHRKDLNEAIENGAYPMWRFGIQVLEESRQDEFEFDILDATKIWPEQDLVPVLYIGELVLNRVVDEYFPETEQVAFCTSHVVPGIGFSDDPLLQGRLFSYMDTQLSRLGNNWQELPINRPVCPVLNHIRDGQHRQTITKGPINYWPNRFSHAPPATKQQGAYIEFPQRMQAIKQRARAPKFQEHFNQATMFYNSMSPIEKLHIANALSFEMSQFGEEDVLNTFIGTLNNVDHALATTVAEKIGVVAPAPARANHGRTAKNLSQFAFPAFKPTIKSRKVAILVADGFDDTVVMALKGVLKAAGALPLVIGPRRGAVKTASGGSEKMDNHFEAARSTLFDSLIVPPGAASTASLAQNGRAVHWVREAFGHCKPIGAIGEGVAFVKEALGIPSLQFAATSGDDTVVCSYGVVTTGKYSAGSAAADIKIGPEEKGWFSAWANELSNHRCWQRELDGLTSKVAF
ncbi:catalase [Auriculariales sp. MPI-PUGE-AT-0066]|nr:catalase [Auriculariales sp. MPI-PUGE-AT-0066]